MYVSQHTISIMSFYPVISNCEVDLEKLSLSQPKYSNTEKSKYLKYNDDKPTTTKNEIISYFVNYNYNRVGLDKLNLITQFFKISNQISNYKNNYVFLIDIESNQKFKTLIDEILEFIKTEILKLHPNLNSNNILLPFTTGQKLKISLTQFNNKITTPIHYHRTKKQGGNILTLVNIHKNEFVSQINEQMTLFQSKKYGTQTIFSTKTNTKTDTKTDIDAIANNYDTTNKPISDDTTNEPIPDDVKMIPIYYEGKFSIYFKVDFFNLDINTKYQKIYCKVNIVAREIETKYNLTKTKSILNDDITKLEKMNVSNIDKLII